MVSRTDLPLSKSAQAYRGPFIAFFLITSELEFFTSDTFLAIWCDGRSPL